jgi:prepilin-type N-terminal cleavage/methylation domain-containing protein
MARRAFTLIELLVVLGIIAIAFAMALSLTTFDKRMANVSAAANELAATLREARALAMQRQSIHAVAFHIQNGTGTSGRLINNWDGEHWYRLLGPCLETNLPAPPDPNLEKVNLAQVVRAVSRSWIGDQHRLAARKVRFVALTDQDNGSAHTWYDGGDTYGRFPTTYPRPWCGWWEASSGRLYPWGGYDSALRDRASTPRPNSGFYYQGNDGAISGSLSPSTRTSTLTKVDMFRSFDSLTSTVLLVQNTPRPLVNAHWLDCRIVFRPDGTVTMPGFMELRFQSRQRNGAGGNGGNAVPGWGDLGDMYPSWRSWWDHQPDERPATSYQAVSGYWWITLGPDLEVDSDVFLSAQAAVRSLQPCFRVGISAIGDVRVVQMRNQLSGTLDASITDWSNRAQTKANYAWNRLSDANGNARGRPVGDALVPDMLMKRSWWYAP